MSVFKGGPIRDTLSCGGKHSEDISLDGRPQMSDAVVDYYFTKKLAYSYIKRSQATFSVIADEIKCWQLPIYACNDTLNEKSGRLTVRNSADGSVIYECNFHAEANASTLIARIPVYYSDRNILIFEWECDGERGFNHYLCANPPISLESYRKVIENTACEDNMYILGFDIGGTKCATVTALWENGELTLLKKDVCPTDLSIPATEMIDRLIAMADGITDRAPDAIGISSGGPLDSAKGVILGPPNLPGWDCVEIVKQIEEHYGVPASLCNDANACAVAEWKFGAGRGTRNMVFLTFGTGLGAGLILDGRLYEGTNGNAGEVGHVRLAKDGPVGFGKRGSFEGFCSGGGISRLAWKMATERAEGLEPPAYYREGMSPSEVTARSVAEAALSGDKTALEVYRISGEYLGRGLAVLVDILNPELIVIGSIFARSGELFKESLEESLVREALAESLSVCRVVPAELGESIGDCAAIAAAIFKGE